MERPGQSVTKHELMTLVWPDTVVEEGNLKVHVAGLRRVLGDGRGGTAARAGLLVVMVMTVPEHS